MLRLGRYEVLQIIKTFPTLAQDCPICEEVAMAETTHIFGTTSWHEYLDRLRELQVLMRIYLPMDSKLRGSDEKN